MKTVLTHGCFDVVHVGHIRLLKMAKAMGDELVVSLLSDEFVTKYKGSKRPIHSLNDRIEHIQALRFVDRIAVVDGPGHEAVEKMISEVRPHLYVKGAEYRGRVPEQKFAESIGVEVRFIEMIRYGENVVSTSLLLKEYLRIGFMTTT